MSIKISSRSHLRVVELTRTRIDMSGNGDEMSTAQRATLSANWGGSCF